jgi:Na+/H+-translocating membrane pyrophosphatase
LWFTSNIKQAEPQVAVFTMKKFLVKISVTAVAVVVGLVLGAALTYIVGSVLMMGILLH